MRPRSSRPRPSSNDTDRLWEACERLLYDALSGDATLFNPVEGIERLWEVSARVTTCWPGNGATGRCPSTAPCSR